MNKAVLVREYGDANVMEIVDTALGRPSPHEVIVRHHAIGINYIDIYFRTGLYPMQLPSGLGIEAAGIVEAVGAEVVNFKVGDRVAYVGGGNGAYAQSRILPVERLIKLPEALAFDTVAAVMLKGLTVQYLFCRTFSLDPQHTLLFHAAAGGVGHIACQWARALGVTMIGTVSSDEKAEQAKKNGCRYVINYREKDFVKVVKEITQGKGVDVVYDSIGQDTWEASLDCIKPLGMMVSFGNASGVVPHFSLQELTKRGSLFVTRPSLNTYIAKREDYESMSQQLWQMLIDGKIVVNTSHTYAIDEVRKAHEDLAARRTFGSSIIRV